MKLVIAILFFVVVQDRNLFAQKITAGMSQEEVRNLFPRYARQIPDTNDIMALDSIAHFKFHGVDGTAYFDFLFNRLHFFRWSYPKEYNWSKYERRPLLTKTDKAKIVKVARGVNADYGPGRRQDAGMLCWKAPHSLVTLSYARVSFAFEVDDSTDFMVFKRGLDRLEDSSLMRH